MQPPPPGQRPGGPPSNPQFPPFNPNNYFIQNPFPYYQNFNPYLQNPNNLFLHNPLLSIQNPNSFAVPNHIQQTSSSFQNPPALSIQNPNPFAALNQNQNKKSSSFQNPHALSIHNPNAFATSNQNHNQNTSSFQNSQDTVQNPNPFTATHQNTSSPTVTPARKRGADEIDAQKQSSGKVEGRKKSAQKVEGKKSAQKVDGKKSAQKADGKKNSQKADRKKSSEKVDRQKQSAEKVDGRKQSAEKVDRQKQSAEKVDRQKKSAEKVDVGKQSAEKVDVRTQSAEKVGVQKQSAEKVDGQKKSADKAEARRQNIETADAAVRKARRELVSSGEGVTAWKLSQAAFLDLKVQSWSALGLQMHDVPSLKQLIATESKLNAFINCFVGVRRITSLYDLEMAICKSEGVEHFEELDLGPLFRHPLVAKYFSVKPEVTFIHKITSEDILVSLSAYMDIHPNQKIDVLEFMDYLAKKHSVSSKEKLCVRIQNLGMHVFFIREALKTEKSAVLKTTKALEHKNENATAKHSSLSSQKKELDKRFHAMSKRVTSFSSTFEDLQSKHIRFASSSSEAEESDDQKSEDGSSSKLFLHPDRIGSCPYPSATEEKTRLFMKDEMDGSIPAADCNINFNSSSKKKRKLGSNSCDLSNPSKLVKRDEICLGASRPLHDTVSREDMETYDDLAGNSSIRAFITTWKEACHNQTAIEVFDRMLDFYKVTRKKKRKINRIFSSNPCAVLLHVALESIKSGMWDSVYDACQSMGTRGSGGVLGSGSTFSESIEIEPNAKKDLTITKYAARKAQSSFVSVDDIVKKLVKYTVPKSEEPTGRTSILTTKFEILKNMSRFEHWLNEQFSVREFKSLGHGEFSEFLERNVSVLPSNLLKQLVGEESEKPLLEVSMLKNQLDLFLLQAFNSLSEDGGFTRHNIHDLLSKQFPSISFSTVQHCSSDILMENMREQRSSAISKCVLFSMTLLDMSSTEDAVSNIDKLPDITHVKTNLFRRSGVLGHKTSKDATESLLQAPMLSNLRAWSHWDVVFAPSLGPLIGWLLDGVRSEELLCLVTTEGVVIRINHLATTTSFLEAARQGSAFHTAVELTSIFSLIGGKKHVPMFLLQNYAQQAFEVILGNAMNNSKMPYTQTLDNSGKSPCAAIYVDVDETRTLSSEPCSAVTNAIRFIIDCLSFVPSEFRDFVAKILLSGLSCFVKNIPSRILYECQKTHERVMIHDIGLSLGITEWIEDHHQFILNTKDFSWDGSITEHVGAETGKVSIRGTGKLEETPCKILRAFKEKSDVRMEECRNRNICDNATCDITVKKPSDKSAEMYSIGDAEMIIESIRREEFGIDSSRPETESIMLMKQHERLGRALQCLSQELYSQDSHFLLELVQNADDNVYPKNVEPTLIFILQETGIVVLNNEHGFSDQNIRALCDIANSTKKVAGAEYIGKKGIGFKSVFRVTDAPEIHSNNFHVKFDIREGQIGFVCPTVIPPCNIEMFHQLACDGTDNEDLNNWRTCIVLPFSSKLSGTATTITPMFADLHPSLLLFLHRLQCIKLRNTLDDSLVVMKKEVIGDGIIKVSRGVEEMTWLVVSQQMQANALGTNSKTTEISIAFTLLESEEGYYSPCLNQQPVFAFLPLRTYGLKFILQGDFVLPSSREGVDADSLWNQWLLSEFPNLFINAEKPFCGIPCYRDNPGKAVSAYMAFVPLVGEVHGFFSNLPRMIISKLRATNCLLKEGDDSSWVPPCKVLRNWSDRALSILPDTLLHDHLGKGFLNRNISLSNPLAEALGVEEYGPNVLLRIISSLCYSDGGLKSLGLEWLCSCLGELYDLMFQLHVTTTGGDMEVTDKLRKIPFIPLSNGTYSSIDEGDIWMHFDVSTNGLDIASGPVAFPYLYARLRTVSSSFLSAAKINTSGKEMMLAEKISILFRHIGVQKLSDHDILKVHILPAIADEKFANGNMTLMTEYLSFIMVHLQSSCTECTAEKKYLISELRSKALVLTNYGYKRPSEVSIHFSKGYGSSVEVTKLINNFEWCEIDDSYSNHSVTKSLPRGQSQWREFFSDLGITDFVSVRQVRKNLSDIPPGLLKTIMLDDELESSGLFAMDWESSELAQVLSLLSSNGSRDNCIYLLKILDTMWDEYYKDKVSGHWNTDVAMDIKPFPSSFLRTICDIQWAVSSLDDRLHYPRDLFHDCGAVRTILGSFAPYAVPKLNNEALLKALGLKTQVTMDDVLEVFKTLKSAGSFKASMEQMSRLYTFIWNNTCLSKKKVLDELLSGPFIFIPEMSDFSHSDLVNGSLYTVKEVYWHDFSGFVSHGPKGKASDGFLSCSSKVLCNIYQGLQDFFVKDCGVNAFPPLHDYLEMLLQLTKSVLPSKAANHAVLQVFAKWADDYDSGEISSKEIDYLKERLLTMEYKILPTEQNKWTSLHPSYGVLCLSDDEKLKKEFRHSEKINFIYFGEVADGTYEVLKTKVHVLLKTLGIPALSQIVTREAIFYGIKDCNIKSLVNWAIPFAQRYMYNLHPERYSQVKDSMCQDLRDFRVIVVEKLFYKNTVKSCALASKKRSECDSLLQENTLYATESSDTHSLFMEFSRHLFKGACDLHLANFLQMITTMAESGSSEDQIEFFILNSQKLSTLPPDESIWSLPSISSADEIEEISSASRSLMTDAKCETKNKTGAVSCWPPANRKTASGFKYARENGYRTKAASQALQSELDYHEDHGEYVSSDQNTPFASDIGVTWISEDVETNAMTSLDLEALGVQPDGVFNQAHLNVNLPYDNTDSNSAHGGWGSTSTNFNMRPQLNTGNPDSAQALLTGKLGELVAYNYYLGKGGDSVNWVNQDNESGLPYDIVIREGGNNVEYIEVKATRSAHKDWFMITTREWQYAIEKGESFSIAHVVLHTDNTAKITTFNNPARLCQLGKLKLVIMMPKV